MKTLASRGGRGRARERKPSSETKIKPGGTKQKAQKHEGHPENVALLLLNAIIYYQFLRVGI